jgi:hypothetical protein
MASTIWQNLEQQSMQFLQNLALQGMKQRGDMKRLNREIAVRTEQNRLDREARLEEWKRNAALKLYEDMSSDTSDLMDEINTLTNTNEITKLAFNTLNPKHKSADKPEDVIADLNNITLEGLNKAYQANVKYKEDLSGIVGNIQKNITNIGDAQRNLYAQLQMIGPGADSVYTPGDIIGLPGHVMPEAETRAWDPATETWVTKADATEINLERLDNAIKAHKQGILKHDTAGMEDVFDAFDLNDDQILDTKDRDIVNSITGIREDMKDDDLSDMSEVYASVTDFFQGSDMLNDLNKLQRIKDSLGATGGSVNPEAIYRQFQWHEERYMKIFDSMKAGLLQKKQNSDEYELTDDLAEKYIEVTTDKEYKPEGKKKGYYYIGDKPNVSAHTAREHNKAVLIAIVQDLAFTGDEYNFFERLEAHGQIPDNKKLVEFLMTEVPHLFGTNVRELLEQGGLMEEYMDYYMLESKFNANVGGGRKLDFPNVNMDDEEDVNKYINQIYSDISVPAVNPSSGGLTTNYAYHSPVFVDDPLNADPLLDALAQLNEDIIQRT